MTSSYPLSLEAAFQGFLSWETWVLPCSQDQSGYDRHESEVLSSESPVGYSG
jgi:hypothetical protein